MAASMASCEAIWLRKLLTGLFDQELEPMVIYYDNQSCIELSEYLVFHDKSCYRAICTLIEGKRQMKTNWHNGRLSYRCHLNKMSLSI
jgi:hypothetical protein